MNWVWHWVFHFKLFISIVVFPYGKRALMIWPSNVAFLLDKEMETIFFPLMWITYFSLKSKGQRLKSLQTNINLATSTQWFLIFQILRSPLLFCGIIGYKYHIILVIDWSIQLANLLSRLRFIHSMDTRRLFHFC